MDPIRVREEDIAVLDDWCRRRGMSPFPPGWLPPTGFWVPGILAAFVYRTDSALAYIECVISNPDTTPGDRQRALFAVNERIEAEARSWGARYLIGLTSIDSVARAGIARGYHVSAPRYAQMIKRLDTAHERENTNDE